MFMSYIGIVVFCLVKVLADPPTTPTKVPLPTKPPDPDGSSPGPGSSTEPCRGDDCRNPPNLIGIILGSVCGILVIALISILFIWFYFRRKNQKRKEVAITPQIKFIEQPSLYTGAISTADSTSRLYGISPSQDESNSSHYYEKIHYNERP